MNQFSDPQTARYLAVVAENQALRKALNDKRQDRWHATYNAVLNGLVCVAQTLEEWHEGAAAEAADSKHGPLEAA